MCCWCAGCVVCVGCCWCVGCVLLVLLVVCSRWCWLLVCWVFVVLLVCCFCTLIGQRCITFARDRSKRKHFSLEEARLCTVALCHNLYCATRCYCLVPPEANDIYNTIIWLFFGLHHCRAGPVKTQASQLIDLEALCRQRPTIFTILSFGSCRGRRQWPALVCTSPPAVLAQATCQERQGPPMPPALLLLEGTLGAQLGAL